MVKGQTLVDNYTELIPRGATISHLKANQLDYREIRVALEKVPGISLALEKASTANVTGRACHKTGGASAIVSWLRKRHLKY